ncbi:hypothetical protein HNQ59_003992 [Chitinivorax tropicus]|uniref:Uncharacterized protein n=1 Tax=Chitinivorax tropicus TaxID=714531 RepID=A0A840MTU4_9PROT|nr:hypothetical protein [Chitinivorax tropicus]MBB5020667.1 hypothetical protein [Chitinivorax tropicus]
MMKEHFTEVGLIRVWESILPVPKFQYEKSDELEFFVRADNQCAAENVVVAVEKFYNAGPRVIYGLLGCTYEIKNQAELDVLVGFNDVSTPCSNHDLANSAGACFLGLDERSARAINSALRARLEASESGLCGGRLVINYAVSSEIGSSPNLFGELAMRLIDEIVLVLKGMHVAP